MMEGGYGGIEIGNVGEENMTLSIASIGRPMDKEQYENWEANCELVTQKCLEYSTRIDMDLFKSEVHKKGYYPPEEVERDKRMCEMMKSNFEEKNKNTGKKLVDASIRSSALEALIVFQERDNWFGENAYLSRTSEYDDYNNHVDVVAEFANEGEETQRLALAIDATTAKVTNHNIVSKKIERNIEEVKYDRTTVKYFESQVEDKDGVVFRGRLKHILPVVIGLDERSTDDLLALSADIFRLEPEWKSGNENLKILRKRISKHPAQLLFLEEIKTQLEMYRDLGIYKKYNGEDRLGNILKTIDTVIGEKCDLTCNYKYQMMKQHDQTYNQIMSKCQNRLKESQNEVKLN